MKRKLLKFLGRGALFGFAFLLFAYWTFPYDRVATFLIQQVEYPAGPGGVRLPSGYQLQIGSLRPSWLTTVELKDIRLSKSSSHPDVPAGHVAVDELRASVSLLSLLVGTVSSAFSLRLEEGGRITGSVTREANGLTSGDLNLNDVELADLSLIRAHVGLPITGSVSADARFSISEDISASNGEFNLTIQGVSIGGDGAKLRIASSPLLRNGLTLERIDAGDLVLTANAEGGVLTLETLEARGNDLILCGNGSLQLHERLAASRLNTLLRVEFSEAYRTSSETTEGLFAALQMDPRARRALDEEGQSLQFRLDGPIGGRVRFGPAGQAESPCSQSDGS